MFGNPLNRILRRHFRAAVIWAMVPMAMINGHIVLGCMSPAGHFEPGCHCQAMQAVADSGKAKVTCQCHCPCCHGGNCCCCQGKANCCSAMAKSGSRTPSDGLHSGDRCRPFSMYAVTPVVNASAALQHAHQLAELSIVSSDLLLVATSTTIADISELNTGPPPDNLVVALHRFLI